MFQESHGSFRINIGMKVTKFHSLLQTCETCCCHWNQAERLKKRKKKKKEAEIAHPHTIQSYKAKMSNGTGMSQKMASSFSKAKIKAYLVKHTKKRKKEKRRAGLAG